MPLTQRQQDFFDWLKQKIATDGKAPSLRKAAAELGISHNAVAQLRDQLERHGLIRRDGHYSRNLRLVEPGAEEPAEELRGGRNLPIIGEIAAGLPIYAQQQWEGTVTVDAQLFPGDNLFCLRIKGESMRDAGILNGDLVICEPRQYAENGETVVALLGDEATVKFFHLHNDCIELRPANPAFTPQRYSFSEVLIQGRVLGVLRTFDS